MEAFEQDPWMHVKLAYLYRDLGLEQDGLETLNRARDLARASEQLADVQAYIDTLEAEHAGGKSSSE